VNVQPPAKSRRQTDASEIRPQIPIVASTAHVVGTAAEERRLAGMDAVIHKPFTIAQITGRSRITLRTIPRFD